MSSFRVDNPSLSRTGRCMPNKKSGGGGRGRKAKAARPTPQKAQKQEPEETAENEQEEPTPYEMPQQYASAAQILAELLPKLAAIGGRTRGRGKDAVWRKLYLHALGHCANVTIAARIASVSREAVRKARAEPEFAAAEKDAIETGVDLVEAAAFKSAVYGDLEPVYWQGIRVGAVVKYSDSMRALILKGRRRDVYAEKVDVEHSGKVTHQHLTLAEFDARCKEAGL